MRPFVAGAASRIRLRLSTNNKMSTPARAAGSKRSAPGPPEKQEDAHPSHHSSSSEADDLYDEKAGIVLNPHESVKPSSAFPSVRQYLQPGLLAGTTSQADAHRSGTERAASRSPAGGRADPPIISPSEARTSAPAPGGVDTGFLADHGQPQQDPDPDGRDSRCHHSQLYNHDLPDYVDLRVVRLLDVKDGLNAQVDLSQQELAVRVFYRSDRTPAAVSAPKLLGIVDLDVRIRSSAGGCYFPPFVVIQVTCPEYWDQALQPELGSCLLSATVLLDSARRNFCGVFPLVEAVAGTQCGGVLLQWQHGWYGSEDLRLAPLSTATVVPTSQSSKEAALRSFPVEKLRELLAERLKSRILGGGTASCKNPVQQLHVELRHVFHAARSEDEVLDPRYHYGPALSSWRRTVRWLDTVLPSTIAERNHKYTGSRLRDLRPYCFVSCGGAVSGQNFSTPQARTTMSPDLLDSEAFAFLGPADGSEDEKDEQAPFYASEWILSDMWNNSTPNVYDLVSDIWSLVSMSTDPLVVKEDDTPEDEKEQAAAAEAEQEEEEDAEEDEDEILEAGGNEQDQDAATPAGGAPQRRNTTTVAQEQQRTSKRRRVAVFDKLKAHPDALMKSAFYSRLLYRKWFTNDGMHLSYRHCRSLFYVDMSGGVGRGAGRGVDGVAAAGHQTIKISLFDNPIIGEPMEVAYGCLEVDDFLVDAFLGALEKMEVAQQASNTGSKMQEGARSDSKDAEHDLRGEVRDRVLTRNSTASKMSKDEAAQLEQEKSRLVQILGAADPHLLDDVFHQFPLALSHLQLLDGAKKPRPLVSLALPELMRGTVARLFVSVLAEDCAGNSVFHEDIAHESRVDLRNAIETLREVLRIDDGDAGAGDARDSLLGGGSGGEHEGTQERDAQLPLPFTAAEAARDYRSAAGVFADVASKVVRELALPPAVFHLLEHSGLLVYSPLESAVVANLPIKNRFLPSEMRPFRVLPIRKLCERAVPVQVQALSSFLEVNYAELADANRFKRQNETLLSRIASLIGLRTGPALKPEALLRGTGHKFESTIAFYGISVGMGLFAGTAIATSVVATAKLSKAFIVSVACHGHPWLYGHENQYVRWFLGAPLKLVLHSGVCPAAKFLKVLPLLRLIGSGELYVMLFFVFVLKNFVQARTNLILRLAEARETALDEFEGFAWKAWRDCDAASPSSVPANDPKNDKTPSSTATKLPTTSRAVRTTVARDAADNFHTFVCVPGSFSNNRSEVYCNFLHALPSHQTRVAVLRYQTNALYGLHAYLEAKAGDVARLYDTYFYYELTAALLNPPSMAVFLTNWLQDRLANQNNAARFRARQVGRQLGRWIFYRCCVLKKAPVSLVAYSYGCSVVMFALHELQALMRAEGIGEDEIEEGDEAGMDEEEAALREDVKHRDQGTKPRERGSKRIPAPSTSEQDRGRGSDNDQGTQNSAKQSEVDNKENSNYGLLIQHDSTADAAANVLASSGGAKDAPPRHQPPIQNLVFMGAHVRLGTIIDSRMRISSTFARKKWYALKRKLIAGRFVNAYASNDNVLTSRAIGVRLYLGKVGLYGVPGVENVNVTSRLHNHASYHNYLCKELLEELDLKGPLLAHAHQIKTARRRQPQATPAAGESPLPSLVKSEGVPPDRNPENVAPSSASCCDPPPQSGPDFHRKTVDWSEATPTGLLKYFLKPANADPYSGKGQWLPESRDLSAAKTLFDLRDYVYPYIGEQDAHRDALSFNDPTAERWEKFDKSIFFYTMLTGAPVDIRNGGGGHGGTMTFPKDKSTRYLSVTTPFMYHQHCTPPGGEDEQGAGKTECSAIERKLVSKGWSATTQDFQDMRENCHNAAGNCEYKESEARYFHRANTLAKTGEQDGSCASSEQKSERISASPRDKKGGFVFDRRFESDRQMVFHGAGYLPGAQYCLGPWDKTSEDMNTRYCACKGYQGANFDLSKIGAEDGAGEASDSDSNKGNTPASSTRSSGAAPTIESWNSWWKAMSEKEKDDFMMLINYRDTGARWWGTDEVISYKDVDPCAAAVFGADNEKEPSAWDESSSASSACCDDVAEDDQAASALQVAGGGGDEVEIAASGRTAAVDDEDGVVVLKTGKERGAQVLQMRGRGAADRSDFHRAAYEFYGPLHEKIVETEHGGDLSKVAFQGSSEGGGIAVEMPLYLMHKKITRAVRAESKKRGLAPGKMMSVAQLAEQVLTTKEKRRPYCVAGVWGPNILPRTESIQGKRNEKRLEEIAAVCGDLVKWNIGVQLLDQIKYWADDSVYEPHLVLHQLAKIAKAGFQHVHSWERPADHYHNYYWATPHEHRGGAYKVQGGRPTSADDERCAWDRRHNANVKPYYDAEQLKRADLVAAKLPRLHFAEVTNGFCLKGGRSGDDDAPEFGYNGDFSTSIDDGLGAKAFFGDAFGYARSDSWGDAYTELHELAFLTQPVQGLENVAGSENLTRHTMRDFRSFRKCVYASEKYKQLAEEKDLQLVGEDFDYEKYIASTDPEHVSFLQQTKVNKQHLNTDEEDEDGGEDDDTGDDGEGGGQGDEEESPFKEDKLCKDFADPDGAYYDFPPLKGPGA
eukprot:g5352.t1